MIKGHFFTYETTFELGKAIVTFDVELEGWFEPGEDMVLYYSDGSGYPGSPAGVEYQKCRVTRVHGFSAYGTIDRKDRPANDGWFKWLDVIAEQHIIDHIDDIEYDMLSGVDFGDDEDYEEEEDRW